MKARNRRTPAVPDRCVSVERPHVEGRHAGLRGVNRDERQDADEQEGGRTEGVQEELPGRVPAPLVAPPGDQEVHRHESELEEHEEEQQVEGEEASRGTPLRARGSRRRTTCPPPCRPKPRERSGTAARSSARGRARCRPSRGSRRSRRQRSTDGWRRTGSRRSRRVKATVAAEAMPSTASEATKPTICTDSALSARDQGDDDRRPGRQQDERREVGERACHDALVKHVGEDQHEACGQPERVVADVTGLNLAHAGDPWRARARRTRSRRRRSPSPRRPTTSRPRRSVEGRAMNRS